MVGTETSGTWPLVQIVRNVVMFPPLSCATSSPIAPLAACAFETDRGVPGMRILEIPTDSLGCYVPDAMVTVEHWLLSSVDVDLISRAAAQPLRPRSHTIFKSAAPNALLRIGDPHANKYQALGKRQDSIYG